MTTKAELREALRAQSVAIELLSRSNYIMTAKEARFVTKAEADARAILARSARVVGYVHISDGDRREEFRVPDFGTAEECQDAASEAAENWGGVVRKLVRR